nr:translesion DNA synthesis-associated protein ImuA [Rhodoferax sp.]
MSAAAHLPSWKGVHSDVWQADALASAPGRVLGTGDAALDAQLPGGGWPLGALSEILQPPGVHNEWRLLLPALARCGTGAVVLVGAPHMPFGPSLGAQGLLPQRLLWVAPQEGGKGSAQRLWATEQALRCADVDAVLAWLVQVRPEQLRRLQMAAVEYDKLLFVLRPEQAQNESSPAVLRLWVAPSEDASDTLEVRTLKRRGPPMDQPLHLRARAARLACLLAAPTLVAARTALRPEGVHLPSGADRQAVQSTLGPPGGETPRSGHALDRTAAHA